MTDDSLPWRRCNLLETPLILLLSVYNLKFPLNTLSKPMQPTGNTLARCNIQPFLYYKLLDYISLLGHDTDEDNFFTCNWAFV